ncbi:MAG: hypothetical protein JRI65_10100 [Deltaproteobacteria bacterium]|nr:hypothetical protein [Deltaproteobacteria bacterium]
MDLDDSQKRLKGGLRPNPLFMSFPYATVRQSEIGLEDRRVTGQRCTWNETEKHRARKGERRNALQNHEVIPVSSCRECGEDYHEEICIQRLVRLIVDAVSMNWKSGTSLKS